MKKILLEMRVVGGQTRQPALSRETERRIVRGKRRLDVHQIEGGAGEDAIEVIGRAR